MESQDLGIAHDLFAKFKLPTDQSPAYYVLLHYWASWRDDSFAYLRLLSAVLAALAVAVTFWLARMVAGYPGGLTAALFLVSNAMLIDAARTARGYTLVVFAASLCVLFAYLFLVEGRRTRHLVGFVVSVLLALYTHLFLLLLVGPLALLIVIVLRRTKAERSVWKRVFLVGGIGVLTLLPQLLRIFNVLGYAEDRQGVYPGMGRGVWSFFGDLGAGFFAGEGAPTSWMPVLALPVVALVLVGMAVLKRRGLVAGLFVILPTLIAGICLNAQTPMHPRYLIYLLPPAAVFVGAALARLRVVYLWAPLAVAIAVAGAAAVRTAPSSADPTYARAIAHLEQIRQPGDVIAVFPGYWVWTWRRFYPDDQMSSFTFFRDLDRIRACGRRVIIVAGPGRPFKNVEAYLQDRAHVAHKWSSSGGPKVGIQVLDPEPVTTVESTPATDPTLVIGGVVGSGGYPWQAESLASNPFARLAEVFQSADSSVTGFIPYRPPWFLWALWGPHAYRSFQPNALVARFLAEAGVRGVVMSPESNAPDARRLLIGAGLRPIAPSSTWREAEPEILDLRGLRVGILYADQRVFTDRPNYRDKGDAVMADWEVAIARARKTVGTNGRLIVLRPQAPDHDRLFRGEDQLVARRAIDLGADVVVGMGGWAVRELEEYKDGIIAYSLGTLLRPGTFGRTTLDSTGALLRLRFPTAPKIEYEIIPVTFDDTFRPALARAEAARNLVRQRAEDPASARLVDDLWSAHAGERVGRGPARAVAEWSADQVRRVSWLDRRSSELQATYGRWFPFWGPRRYPHDGYSSEDSEIAIEGVLSLDQYRRALVFDPDANRNLWAVFPTVRLGERLVINYGMGNHALADKVRTPKQQNLAVSIANRVVWKAPVHYLVGWQSAPINTREWSGTEQDVTIAVESDALTHFPVAVDPIVERSPEAIAALAQLPYSFEEHLRQARVVTQTADQIKPCFGPDETFRLLRGGRQRRLEEHGPLGEGVLHARWVCGSLPWDCAALTVQQSGGDLRRAIWLHPTSGGKRLLTYGPLTTRARIRGYYGLTDLAAGKAKAPVEFSILIDGRPVFREKLTGARGWQSFVARLPPELQDRTTEISFLVETADQTWRHFCFNAWME